MSAIADAQAVMQEMIESHGLMSAANYQLVGKCNCGRPITEIQKRCMPCMVHELKEYCGDFHATRFMLALKELSRAHTGVLWCAEHGEIPK